MKVFPRLYAILDGEAIRGAGLTLIGAAEGLHAAGVRLVQYRDKLATSSEVLERALAIKKIFSAPGTILVMNDFPELVEEAGWSGVHLGQADMDIRGARRLLGAERLIGVSTHTLDELRDASKSSADYIAYGPIFATSSKHNAEPIVGLNGLRAARTMTVRPLVAIGGISQARIPEVLATGADSVAVIGAFFQEGKSVEENASDLVQEVNGWVGG